MHHVKRITDFDQFQIELLDWKPEDLSPRSNGGILRHVIKRAITRKTPNDGATVNGKLSNRITRMK